MAIEVVILGFSGLLVLATASSARDSVMNLCQLPASTPVASFITGNLNIGTTSFVRDAWHSTTHDSDL